MSDLTMQARDGSDGQLPGSVLEGLIARVRGQVLVPGDEGYDDARTIWNAMVDRRPSVIVRCATPGDVQEAVRLAAAHDLRLSIKGGGHNIAGNAVCDGGLMIDLSPMRAVHVDEAARTAMVEAGCTLADVDAATQKHGLATPLGINSTTGVAGLTLGGGFGWLSRKHGMTVDNLRSAQIVTATGERLTVSAVQNEDLFWGIRGGGGNFGVVTSFEFDLHPVGPEVLSGLIVHPFADAGSVLRAWRDFAEQAPDELSVWVVMRKAPPLPFLPPEWHGREVVVLAAFHAGDMAEGERLLEPLRGHGRPIADVIGPHPYAGWQQAFDPLLTPGSRNYWKSHDFTRLDDGLLDALVDRVGRLPTDQTEIFLGQVGGAMGRVPAGATAYPHRDARYIMNVHGRWDGAPQDGPGIAWCREVFATTEPWATGGVYVNFLTEDEAVRVASAYGPNYARLADLKLRYDPDNLFRMNQNIRPASPA